jgi:nitrate/nitrite-specific signal transduction histidine kinase
MDSQEARLLNEVAALRIECEAMRRQIEHFGVLRRITQELVSEVDIDCLLQNILRSAVQVMRGTAGSLILLDEQEDELVFRVVEGGGGPRLHGKRMARQQGIAGWVLENQEAVIVDDTSQDQRFYAEVPRSVGYSVTSMICVPMIVRGKPIGVIQILNKQDNERFDETDKALLLTFAAQSAIALRNAQLYQELREERDRLVIVEEDVRRELARDLHDGPTQLVAAIAMNLQFIRRMVDSEPDQVRTEIEEMERLAKDAMRQLRNMLFDLRPVLLETKGLIPALQAYSQRMTETEHFAVHFQTCGELPSLSNQASSAVFAIVQEAVGNARKHAYATNIWLTVECRDDALQVTVQDDGRGFEPSEIQANYGLRDTMGMINMRERAAMIEGAFSVESQVGRGTTVRLVTPLSPNLEERSDA